MQISEGAVIDTAHEYGFQQRALEKTARLLSLLNAINRHDFLQDKFALKGGTALHMFIMDVNRLSVDIDIHYLGEGGLEDYAQIVSAFQEVFNQENLGIKRIPKPIRKIVKWRVGFQRVADDLGRRDLLAVDIDFQSNGLLRPLENRDSHPLGPWKAFNIPTANVYEIAAGKLNALLERRKARDLYDASLLSKADWLDFDQLQWTFLESEANKGIDPRLLPKPRLSFDKQELRMHLLPVLRKGECEDSKAAIRDFGQGLQRDSTDFIDALLSFSAEQSQWLDTKIA